jgi:hypothetical protein
MERDGIPQTHGVKAVSAMVSIDSRKYRLAVVGLVFATGLTCLHVFGPYTGDSTRYLALARNLAAGNGFSASVSWPYYPEIFRAPLYPLFLSGFFRLNVGVTGVILIQLALYSVAVLAMTRVSLAITGNQLAGFLLGILLSVYAPCLRWASAITTESLCMVLFCLVCLLLARHLRSPSYGTSGLLGLMIVGLFYTRATYFFVAPLVVILCIIRSRGRAVMRYALVLAIVTFAPIGAWVVRNAAVVPEGFHPFGVGTGMALYVKKLELLEPNYDERTKATIESADYQAFYKGTDPAVVLKADERMAREGVEAIQEHKTRYLANVCWLVLFREWAEMYDPTLPGSVAWIPTLVSAFLVICAYIGLFLMRDRLTAVLPLGAMALLVAAVHAIFATEARYTSPVRPVLYMLSAAPMALGIQAAWKTVTNRRAQNRRASATEMAHSSGA